MITARHRVSVTGWVRHGGQRIQQAGITYYADPALKQAGEINRHHGGRGLYFLDPAGHGMEIITRPYGSHEATSTAS
jgi:extradiol dioxygenase family protein